MNYININKKKLVGRNNQICSSPIVLDYSTVEEISFQFINDQNQIQGIEGLTGLYFAGSLGIGQQSYDLLFLSKDFTIENDVLTFRVDTYTRNYLDKIKKKNTEINIEIGLISVETKKVMLRDYASAYPRVYVAGLSPQEIDSHDYYTKEEVDELIAGSELSGYATEEYVDEAVATKQDIIDADNKLSYALVSGAPTIPTKTSDLQNDSGFITDSALQGYATETYVNSSVSGKADKSEIPTKTSDLQNDSGFITENALSGKQDKITAENKLAYSLISGTPTIPTKTSDLTNDSDFQNASQVQTAISGKQDKITSESKLDYALLSGTPIISDSTITLTQGGTTKGSFTLNQSSGTTIELDAGESSAAASSVITPSAYVEITMGSMVSSDFAVSSNVMNKYVQWLPSTYSVQNAETKSFEVDIIQNISSSSQECSFSPKDTVIVKGKLLDNDAHILEAYYCYFEKHIFTLYVNDVPIRQGVYYAEKREYDYNNGYYVELNNILNDGKQIQIKNGDVLRIHAEVIFKANASTTIYPGSKKIYNMMLCVGLPPINMTGVSDYTNGLNQYIINAVGRVYNGIYLLNSSETSYDGDSQNIEIGSNNFYRNHSSYTIGDQCSISMYDNSCFVFKTSSSFSTYTVNFNGTIMYINAPLNLGASKCYIISYLNGVVIWNEMQEYQSN